MSNKIISGTDWIDVSVPVSEKMAVFAYEQKPQFERRASMDRGDMGNNSTIHMGIHTGTHLDAPRHGIIDGKTIDKMPLSDAIGPARVIEINDMEAVRAEALKQYQFKRGERVLFKTQNSARCWKTDAFVADFVYIATDAAQILADAEVRLVGIDYLSVGGPPETHKILLCAGVWLLEGLDLSAVIPGNYNLVCLPLRLIGVEGSPVRAVLQPLP
ncbi:MAG: cyclase family protein [Dehalococcoidales bacterium]|jgi:arylformamidase